MKRLLIAAILALSASAALSQVTPAAGITPPDDTPSVKLGGTIFADFTRGDRVSDAFNVSRTYLNVTGNLNHLIAFRVTPDITREAGTGSSLNGSLTFRLKYAYAQLNLDDWTTKGSWVRLGMQQTPFVDYEETIYRYRFQGPVFVDREGYLASSDFGLSGRWNFPGGYGDLHGGYYNGEGYNRAEVNDEKAFQLRAGLRPFPLGGIWKGLRVAGFVDEDHYQAGARRQRFVEQVSFEHPRVNAGAHFLQAKDRATAGAALVEASGYSIWATPKIAGPWELLLRHDELQPNKATDQKRKRDIAGLAYWVPNLQKVAAALMLDYDSLRQSGFTPRRPRDTRYGLKLLINF